MKKKKKKFREREIERKKKFFWINDELLVATPVCIWQAFTMVAAVAIILSDTKLGRVCKHNVRAHYVLVTDYDGNRSIALFFYANGVASIQYARDFWLKVGKKKKKSLKSRNVTEYLCAFLVQRVFTMIGSSSIFENSGRIEIGFFSTTARTTFYTVF